MQPSSHEMDMPSFFAPELSIRPLEVVVHVAIAVQAAASPTSDTIRKTLKKTASPGRGAWQASTRACQPLLERDEKGNGSVFYVDFCRAIAAAIF